MVCSNGTHRFENVARWDYDRRRGDELLLHQTTGVMLRGHQSDALDQLDARNIAGQLNLDDLRSALNALR